MGKVVTRYGITSDVIVNPDAPGKTLTRKLPPANVLVIGHRETFSDAWNSVDLTTTPVLGLSLKNRAVTTSPRFSRIIDPA